MPYFSESSKKRLTTLHPDLQRVLNKAIKITDFSIICGLRNEETQTRAVSEKRSKANWPDSKHNRSWLDGNKYDYTVSDAVDIAPYPIRWPDIQTQTTKEYVKRMGMFYLLAGVIIAIAQREGIAIRWGGTFKSFFDGPHFERVV